jgi:hypothetical protein
MMGPEYFTVAAYITDGAIICRECGEMRGLPASDQLTKATVEADYQDDGLYCDGCTKEIVEEPEHYLTCEYCGKAKPDVSERPDPYANDVGNDPDAVHTACDACAQNRADDI